MAVDAPRSEAERIAEHLGEPVVGEHLPAHGGLVAPGTRRAGRRPRRAPCDRGSPPPPRCRWPGPGRCPRRSSGRRRPPRRPTNSTRPSASTTSSMRAGMGQARWVSSGSASGPSRARMCGRASRSGQQPLHVVGGDLAAPHDAEADVGVAVADRERPEVAGQEVGFEEDPEVAGGGRRHPAHVLAERVPLAPVARRVQAEPPAQRRPHAVGPDHEPGLDRRAVEAVVGRSAPARAGPIRPAARRPPGLGPRARWRRPGGRGRPARRRAHGGGPPPRTAPVRSAAGTARRGRPAPAPRRRSPGATTARRPGRARGPRAAGALRRSARRRRTCPGGRWPCRRPRRRARGGPA